MYSPDPAPSDFHLFRSLSNRMRGVSFNDNEELKMWLDNFYDSTPSDFYRCGIEKLVKRWHEIVDIEGYY